MAKKFEKLSEEKFKKAAKNCPQNKNGDCKLQITDVDIIENAYDRYTKTEFSYESCNIHFCPGWFWMNAMK